MSLGCSRRTQPKSSATYALTRSALSRPAQSACHTCPVPTSSAVSQPPRTQLVSMQTRNPRSRTSPDCCGLCPTTATFPEWCGTAVAASVTHRGQARESPAVCGCVLAGPIHGRLSWCFLFCSGWFGLTVASARLRFRLYQPLNSSPDGPYIPGTGTSFRRR